MWLSWEPCGKHSTYSAYTFCITYITCTGALLLTVEAGEQEHCELNKKQNELNSFLWTIKRDPPSFFFGTIHVPYTRVWDFIPENSKHAFQQSRVVYFELDLTDPSTIADLASCQLLPQGERLRDVLPSELYKRLKRHLEYVRRMLPFWMTPSQRGRGLYAEYLFNAMAGDWERKRPVWVMLMVNALTEADVRARGAPVLDLYLAQEAERARKRTGAVETVEEQCHPLNGLNLSQVIFALNQTLLQQERLREGRASRVPYTTDDLIKHYNCGDLSAAIFNHDTSQVPNFHIASLPASERLTAQEIDGYFRQELIYKRNERMGRRVQALLENSPGQTFFFAFGAGHFLGNNTVIDVLRSQGYEVEHTPAGQSIHRGSSHINHQDLDSLLEPTVAYHSHVQSDKLDMQLKKRRRSKVRRPSLRHFSDLWVRLNHSSRQDADAPPLVHVTAQPHFHAYWRSSEVQMPVSSALTIRVPISFVLLISTHMMSLS